MYASEHFDCQPLYHLQDHPQDHYWPIICLALASGGMIMEAPARLKLTSSTIQLHCLHIGKPSAPTRCILIFIAHSIPQCASPSSTKRPAQESVSSYVRIRRYKAAKHGFTHSESLPRFRSLGSRKGSDSAKYLAKLTANQYRNILTMAHTPRRRRAKRGFQKTVGFISLNYRNRNFALTDKQSSLPSQYSLIDLEDEIPNEVGEESDDEQMARRLYAEWNGKEAVSHNDR
jgi:hypothetical protein